MLTRRAARELAIAGDIEQLRKAAGAGDRQARRQLASWLARTGADDELAGLAAAGDRFARREVADQLVRRGRHDEAVEIMRPLAAGHPGARGRLARLLAGLGRVDEAIGLIEAAPGTDPLLGYRMVRWFVSQGRVDDLWRLARLDDDRIARAAAEELTWIAQRRWEAVRLREAVDLLERLGTIRHRPDRDISQVLVHIARHFWREGRLAGRKEAIDRLAASREPVCRRTRARLLLLQERRAEAIDELRTLAEAGDRYAAGELDRQLRLVPPARVLHALAHTGGGYLRAVAYRPDGKVLATTGGNDHTVLLWDPASGEHLRTIQAGYAAAVAFSPDGTLLATNGGGHTRLWDAETGHLVRERRANTFTAAVGFSPDGSVAIDDRLWSPLTGADRGAAGGTVLAVAFSPDGRLLAVAGKHRLPRWKRPAAEEREASIRLLDPATGALLHQLGDTEANAVAFSPDGALIAIADDAAVSLWTPTGELVRRLDGRGAKVLAFHPAGHLLAAARRDDLIDAGIRLWHPGTGELVAERGPGADAVAFSPDGTTLAAASEADAVVRLWPV